ncbi:MAG: ATP-dependent DNA helicase RecG [Candidatus Eisenbacteria bacterium]
MGGAAARRAGPRRGPLLDHPARAGLESDWPGPRALPAHPSNPEGAIATEITLQSKVGLLKGVGPRFVALFARAGVETIEDLLYYVPRTYADWSNIASVGSLRMGDRVTVVVRVVSCDIIRRGRMQIFVAAFEDDTGAIVARWFGQPYLQTVLKPGGKAVVSGQVRFDRFSRRIEFLNPSFEVMDENEAAELVHAGRIVPEYSQIGQLSGRRIRSLVKTVLDGLLDELVDPLPEVVLASRALPGLKESMAEVHFPSSVERAARARSRLAYEEFFLFQVVVALRKRQVAGSGGAVPIAWSDAEHARLIESLAFGLTGAQERVISEIAGDIGSGAPMNRLLQGDVGSGKTAVAASAMHQAVAAGHQAAIMAPTEILAEQHLENLRALLSPLGDRVVLLRGGMKAGERNEALGLIESGEAQIIVGTHALIQEGTTFADLALAVVDEQHRFGVVQRAALRGKGSAPHILVMTATPIPRTLALTVYGDLDVSVLDEMPPGRERVATAIRDEAARKKVYDFLKTEVAAGRQIFIVYPLVEESEKMELAAATKMYEKLKERVFTDATVGLVHGRMKPEDKDAVMETFKAGDTDILVSTTVVEVGVDIPNATVMLIEHAERFGLAQLHQLRGRVGRGDQRSYCILMVGRAASDEARERIQVLADTNDGFVIAEKDLEMRGPGEFLGVRQHGLPTFSVADLGHDSRLLVDARDDAFAYVAADPEMSTPAAKLVLDATGRRFKDHGAFMDVG